MDVGPVYEGVADGGDRLRTIAAVGRHRWVMMIDDPPADLADIISTLQPHSPTTPLTDIPILPEICVDEPWEIITTLTWSQRHTT